MLYESGIDPLVAMRIVGHADYQTTANIYTHLHDETLRRAYVNLEQVFSGEQSKSLMTVFSAEVMSLCRFLWYNGFGLAEL